MPCTNLLLVLSLAFDHSQRYSNGAWQERDNGILDVHYVQHLQQGALAVSSTSLVVISNNSPPFK
jgi:uncharacterized membrane protein